MKSSLQLSVIFFALAVLVLGCVSPIGTRDTPSASNQQAEAAMTLQALASQSANPPDSVSETARDLLPQPLYFLAPDNQAISQIYRLEHDGRTRTQLTSEPVDVWDYDVSPADGGLAYEANNQLVLVSADGSNRRVLVEGVPNPDIHGVYSPTFSPDGQTLAYAHNGLNLYSVSTGLSNLVIPDQVNDLGDGQVLPVETYSPERYSPDGTKLLLALGHWEVAPSHAVYYPDTNALVRYEEVDDYIYCCSFHGGPVWSPDGSSFYGVASAHDYSYKSGELWKVDAATGTLTRALRGGDGTVSLPKELYLAPNGQLYFFLGTYTIDSGFFDAPVLKLVRSTPDGVSDRTVLRQENFVLMNEALWAPDASFVIVATAPDRNWNQGGGVLALYYTDAKRDADWLAPFGREMKWGP
jgi:Tol biopolymer transport system component